MSLSLLPCNAASDMASRFLPSEVPNKRAAVLDHLANFRNLVEVRPASLLEARRKPEMLSTGIAEVDAIAGGFPRGCLSEIYGSASSGKTSVLQATIAAATRRAEACVLIDASDSFDPESGAAAGIEFGKLLWVRCGGSILRNSVASVVENSKNFNHIGPKDRQRKQQSENRLGQVLKSVDLILQSGGFGLVAIDLSGIPEKFVRRIPLASWFRFQRTVEHTKTALLVVSEFVCAESCATVVLKLSAFSRRLSGTPSHALLFQQLQVEAEVVRTRLERKPMGAVKAAFATRAVRAG